MTKFISTHSLVAGQAVIRMTDNIGCYSSKADTVPDPCPEACHLYEELPVQALGSCREGNDKISWEGGTDQDEGSKADYKKGRAEEEEEKEEIGRGAANYLDEDDYIVMTSHYLGKKAEKAKDIP